VGKSKPIKPVAPTSNVANKPTSIVS
jgi:hypothetical protein